METQRHSLHTMPTLNMRCFLVFVSSLADVIESDDVMLALQSWPSQSQAVLNCVDSENEWCCLLICISVNDPFSVCPNMVKNGRKISLLG